MTTITMDEELQARFQAVAAPEEVTGMAKTAIREFVERRERERASRTEAHGTEAQSVDT